MRAKTRKEVVDSYVAVGRSDAKDMVPGAMGEYRPTAREKRRHARLNRDGGGWSDGREWF